MRYAFFDEQGRVSSAYNDQTSTNLPDGAQPLTAEQWEKRFDLRLVNGELFDDPFVVVKPLPQLIAERIGDINRKCEQAVAQVSAGYPPSEVLSWSKQETEARAWLANNSAATPLIDALAASRGVAKADLVDRIIDKADLFAGVSGQLIGKRQGLEDQVNALQAQLDDPQQADPTAADIEAIAW